MSAHGGQGLTEEQARLRRIGITTIVVVVAIIVLATVALGGGDGDDRPVLVVFTQNATTVDVVEGDFVRVSGTMRSRNDDEDAVALRAEDIRKSRASDSASGLTDVDDLRDNGDRVGDEVTVVGRVETVDLDGSVLAISQP